MSDRVRRLYDRISCLTAAECLELTRLMAARWGVSPLPPAAPLPQPPPAPEPEPEERVWFDVVLVGTGPRRLQVIRAVREVGGLGLRESKELVDSVPVAVLSGVGRTEAEEVRGRLAEAGAAVEVR